jgi:hypothetical protein
MFKKMLMIASMALAVVAFAAPASALADWTHGEAPLEGEAHVTFSGKANFKVPLAKAGAEAELTVTGFFQEGSTGIVTSIVAHNCKGLEALAGTTCTSTFESTTPNGTYDPVSSAAPLTMHCNSATNTITITHVRVSNRYWAGPHSGTPVKTTVLTGDIIATPNSSEAISSVSLSSENATVEGAPATIGGTLAASPAGTYGCE